MEIFNCIAKELFSPLLVRKLYPPLCIPKGIVLVSQYFCGTDTDLRKPVATNHPPRYIPINY